MPIPMWPKMDHPGRREEMCIRDRPEDNDQVFTAKYLPYLPSKEELARELSAEYRAINEATNGETQG